MTSNKFTTNKLLLLFFCFTSIFPILILGFSHAHYIHKILNTNQSFLKLIEHEEFVLLSIYLVIIVFILTISIFVLNLLVIKPLREVFRKFDELANGQIPNLVKTDNIFLFEINNFINGFNKMVKTLKQARSQQDEFISTLTHDLKVPLLAEQKAFELLKDYELDKTKKEKVVESLDKSNKSLLSLINTLLDSYKIESGKLIITKKEIDFKELIQETHLSLFPLIEEKNIELVIDLQENLSLSLDKAQIQRVLKNIIHNAIKNSSIDGQIKIEAKVDDNNLKLIIADRGCGIVEDQVEAIFEKYNSDSQGLGLGLYISRLIIEAHEGVISVSSKIDEGTNFEILLPLK